MPETLYLFDHACGKALQQFKLQAALQGIDLDKPTKPTKQAQNQTLPMFGDPDDYKKMTPEQREQETERMMKSMKRFAADPIKYASRGGKF